MSTMEERVNGWLDSLSTLVDKAKEQQEAAGPLASFITAVQRFSKSLPANESEEAYNLADALGDSLTPITDSVMALTNFADAMAKLTGQDRSEGDQMAKSLSMAVESSLLEGEARERAEGLLAAWKDTAPKGRSTGGGGSSTSPAGKALPFPVKVTCEADNWSARQTGNVNSLRWAAIQHHEKAHGNRPAKGDPIHQGITEAILSVVDEKSQSAQGGGYIVDRTA